MLGKEKALQIIQQVLSLCQGHAAEVVLMTQDDSLTRFANNAIHQNVAERNVNLIVRYILGKRLGMATTNRFDTNALEEAVLRAQVNAEASPEDPDYPGLPSPAEYAAVEAYDAQTADFTPEGRAQAVGTVCAMAKVKGLNASGAFSTGLGEIAIGNSQGVFAHFFSTHADFQTVVMSEDSSGHAHGSGWRVAAIPVEKLGEEAVKKAEYSRNPQPIEPGEYTVVLDPYATEDILLMLNYHGMGAQAVLEGRSWMNSRMGQKAMSEKVSIWDDGLDPSGSPVPFDFEGVPRQRVEIIQQGLVQGPVYDRYTAAKMGKTSTGHALPPTSRGFGPLAANLFMQPGDETVEEMIRSTERGFYISRFWYTRLVHPRDCVITGMTRDGVFLIENGQIGAALKNLRFTQSYVAALANLEAVGKEAHLLMSEFGGLAVSVPAVKIARFNFTGATV